MVDSMLETELERWRRSGFAVFSIVIKNDNSRGLLPSLIKMYGLRKGKKIVLACASKVHVMCKE